MAMTATPHAPPHVFLLDGARQAQLPPAQLLELALRDPRLKLGVRQFRWLYRGVYEDFGYGDLTFIEAEKAIPDEDPPHKLKPGLVLLLPEDIDRLRGGGPEGIHVNRVVHVASGLDVQLVSKKKITIDQIWLDPEVWGPVLEALASGANTGPTLATLEPAPTQPRWGTVEEAAACLEVSRDTIDRMRRKQRDKGWALPGDPVRVGLGEERKREKWDLDRVEEWARAFDAKKLDKPRSRPATTKRRGSSGKPQKPKNRSGSSLYARAKARVANPKS